MGMSPRTDNIALTKDGGVKIGRFIHGGLVTHYVTDLEPRNVSNELWTGFTVDN